MIVHQLKEAKGNIIVTKCGLEISRKRTESWSGWHSQINCKDCLKDLRMKQKHDTIDRPGTEVRAETKEQEEMAKDPKVIEFDKSTMAEVKNLRDVEGMKWGEIAEAMNMASGKAILIYYFATVKPADKVKDATAAQVRKLRDGDNLSWGAISARTALSESTLRSMYEAASSRSAKGTRIGKGGRYPLGEEPAGSEVKPATKKTTKAPAKKAAAPAAKASPLKGLKSQEIKDALTGFAVKYGPSNEVIAVKEVKKASANAVVLTDAEGKARTLKTAGINEISKKKVV